MPLQRPLESSLIRQPRRPLGWGRAWVALPANIELRGPRGPEALHHQAEYLILNLQIEHTPHYVALRRPQMEEALVVLAGNGVLGMRQVEYHGAVFQNDRGTRASQEVSNRANQ